MTLNKQIEEYLFDTNHRWMAIKTKIVNRMPLADWEYEEYNQIREKTVSFLSSQRDELVKEIEKKRVAVTYESDGGRGWAVPMAEIYKIKGDDVITKIRGL